jgi:hypothetical protein
MNASQSPGSVINPSILWHREICGAADEAVLKIENPPIKSDI